MGLPTGREAEPGAQLAGDLEDFALFVEVDGVDGEAHEAHVDAVARRNEQSRGGQQGAAHHEAAEALPESSSKADSKGGIRVFYLECFCLHDCFFLMILDHGPHPPLTRFPLPRARRRLLEVLQ